MLLDDPLSAVDPRVAQTLFAHCIGPEGIMQVGKLRNLLIACGGSRLVPIIMCDLAFARGA